MPGDGFRCGAVRCGAVLRNLTLSHLASRTDDRAVRAVVRVVHQAGAYVGSVRRGSGARFRRDHEGSKGEEREACLRWELRYSGLMLLVRTVPYQRWVQLPTATIELRFRKLRTRHIDCSYHQGWELELAKHSRIWLSSSWKIWCIGFREVCDMWQTGSRRGGSIWTASCRSDGQSSTFLFTCKFSFVVGSYIHTSKLSPAPASFEQPVGSSRAMPVYDILEPPTYVRRQKTIRSLFQLRERLCQTADLSARLLDTKGLSLAFSVMNLSLRKGVSQVGVSSGTHHRT